MFKFFQFQKKNIWLNVYNEKIRNFIGCPFCLFHLHPLYFSFFFHSFLFQFIIDWFEISNIFHYYIHKTSFKNHYITSDIDYIRGLKVYFFFILMTQILSRIIFIASIRIELVIVKFDHVIFSQFWPSQSYFLLLLLINNNRMCV